ncbi:hypothetical protein E2K80_02065 [Rhodophyticola sp. CCM32]|uniref:GFA family protein n=1 Tax=Rhodophyticola sp. CCM32 TaxID=2916397 RepID=UPI00107F4C76|nr:GFA family protein [Rhodophyticola sp. CCM32]QBX99658.1 hypothetical protein E2K80_02065 [Rhodophyticola sp. CCM32]
MKREIISCTCGQTKAAVSAMPRLRFRCHCSKCQSTYKGPFADALVFRRGQVHLEDANQVDWIHTMRPSPLVRGICKSCHEPILAHFYFVFSIIPAIAMPGGLVPPVGHDVYYGTRAKALNDGVPKHDTVLGSYLALALPFAGVLALPGRTIAAS